MRLVCFFLFLWLCEHTHSYIRRLLVSFDSLSIQYVVALLRLLKNGRTFRRTIHASFVPDEEVLRQNLELMSAA